MNHYLLCVYVHRCTIILMCMYTLFAESITRKSRRYKQVSNYKNYFSSESETGSDSDNAWGAQSDCTEDQPLRRRGRPPGSKNKLKMSNVQVAVMNARHIIQSAATKAVQQQPRIPYGPHPSTFSYPGNNNAVVAEAQQQVASPSMREDSTVNPCLPQVLNEAAAPLQSNPNGSELRRLKKKREMQLL